MNWSKWRWKYSRAISYGAEKYDKSLEFDKKAGDVIKGKKQPCFDFEKLEQDQLHDGYSATVTGELEMSEQQIINTYRGLWEIEETFNITKGTLEARPVYVSRKDRIGAHFLTCFIALVIIRLIQKKTNRRYSAQKIISYLNNISCSNELDNLYMFDYRTDISDTIGDALGINFTLKRLRLKEIKNILANSKKWAVPHIFPTTCKGCNPFICKGCGPFLITYAVKVRIIGWPCDTYVSLRAKLKKIVRIDMAGGYGRRVLYGI